LLSASDLVSFMECEHLAALDLRAVRGVEVLEPSRDDAALLVARKGDEHEQSYLARMLTESRDVVVVPPTADGLGSLREAVERTTEAMSVDAEVIYQGALLDGDWRGYADFLERVAVRSGPVLGWFECVAGVWRPKLRGAGQEAGAYDEAEVPYAAVLVQRVAGACAGPVAGVDACGVRLGGAAQLPSG
jgi:hypothetical protein